MPPVTMWTPLQVVDLANRRTTILPVLSPLCSARNANSCCASMLKLCSGRLVNASALARDPSNTSTPYIHLGSSAMSASSAIAQYEVAGEDARWRSDAQMLRLPISSKAPPSPSYAKDAAMKSRERLLSTVCDREAAMCRAKLIERAAPSRELHKATTSVERS